MPEPAQIFDYPRWEARLDELHQRYRSANPFPHIMLDGLLNAAWLQQVVQEFPAPDSPEWIQYRHLNSRKLGATNRAAFPPTIGATIDELNRDRFVRWITHLTDIDGLFADPSLSGGGMHQSRPGGYLNIHADFTVHTYHRDWLRRVNVLVYLNQNWRDDYGGHLELWDRQMQHRVERIRPDFNRCVIFNTDADSFHGHPEPLRCPRA